MLHISVQEYRYPGTEAPALQGIELELGPHQIVGVVGPGGGGKTTLCLIACGAAPRVVGGILEGAVHVDGADLAALPPEQWLRAVALCGGGTPGHLSGACDTVYDEVAFGPSNLGQGGDRVRLQTETALSVLAISHLSYRDPSTLSGGEQRLVALAGGLAMGARYLVVDEPSAELDSRGKRHVKQALRAAAAAGAGVLVSETDTDFLTRLCDRLLVMANGQMQVHGHPMEVLADERLPKLGVAPPSAVRLRRRLKAEHLLVRPIVPR